MTKSIRKKIRIAIYGAAVAIILYGCYPGGAEYTSDQDLVATEYNVDYYDGGSRNEFNDWKTYYMPDTVDFQSNNDEAEMTPEEQRALIEAFETELENRNFRRITDTVGVGAPDFAVNLTVLAVENSGAVWLPPPWPPYYPPGWGWGPGWGWYYPGYWVPYSYNTGTVSAYISDPNNPIDIDGDEVVPVAWRSVLNGLISSSQSNNVSRIDRMIGQAFVQSPYLESKK
jgi:hypothetical protein